MKTTRALALALLLCPVCLSTTRAEEGPRCVLEVTTSPGSGRSAPRHVLAVWITDAQDQFVATVEVRAGKRKKYLAGWLAALGQREPDGIAGATLKTHEPRVFTWDCRDAAGQLVPPGAYRWNVEISDRNKAGWRTPPEHLAFVVGPEPVALKPSDLPNFQACTLVFTPGPAAAQGE